LILIGLGVGAYGTLIGAGGGFVLVPILLLLYPRLEPRFITTISLAVVFFNAASGSLAYARMGRVDFRSGLIFAAATVPGAIIGVWAVGYMGRGIFNLIFGLLLIVIATYLFLRPGPGADSTEVANGNTQRRLVDRRGEVHTYSFNLWLGSAISLAIGFVSSLLGIGGGIIHVPALVQLLGFPVHIATATSHFVLAITALVGTLTHAAAGDFQQGDVVATTLLLAGGVIVGAQIGARLSRFLRGAWIIRLLAIALAMVGARLVL